jgi:hypothetical protein
MIWIIARHLSDINGPQAVDPDVVLAARSGTSSGIAGLPEPVGAKPSELKPILRVRLTHDR